MKQKAFRLPCGLGISYEPAHLRRLHAVIVLLTLMVNARHLFYGLAMLSLLLSLSLGYKKEVNA